MSLIDSSSVAAQVAQLRLQSNRMYTNLKVQHTYMFNAIWNNPNFSPMQIIEEFGTDAVALFQVSEGIQGLLKIVDPSYVPLTPTGYTIVPNQDGTVTITKDS